VPLLPVPTEAVAVGVALEDDAAARAGAVTVSVMTTRGGAGEGLALAVARPAKKPTAPSARISEPIAEIHAGPSSRKRSQAPFFSGC
jgi:hypothetical protein